MSRDPYKPFRLNGGRFYQQARRIKKREREYSYSYWYCRSGWGKVTHLGSELPAAVEAARATQWAAADILATIERIAAVLRRFTQGDVLTSADLLLLSELGLSLPDDVRALTQQVRPELEAIAAHDWERTRDLAEEVLTDDDRALLVRLGLEKFVYRPAPCVAQTGFVSSVGPGDAQNGDEKLTR